MSAWFTEDDLHEAAGGQSYQRGRDYVAAVADVAPTALGVRATVRGLDTYEVWLGRDAERLVGECSCPFGADGNFCKHCVAVGLVLLADGPGPPAPEVDLAAYLRTLDPRELVELVLEQAGRDPALFRRLSLRAGTTGAPQVAVLRRQLEEALRVRGYLDDRATRDYARRAREVLDTVDELITTGHASEARPLARSAVEGITAALSTVDDSAGTVTGLYRRALSLYARACAAARPNPARLAEWIFRQRLDGPGWPVVELAEFADTLGEAGMSAYRTLVREACVSPPEDKVVVLRAMRMQLATVDGDLDARVDILAENVPDPKAFLDIVALLREAGRLVGAIRWAERGVAETGDPRLADVLVQSYVDAERPADAVALRESALRSAPTRLSYANLRTTASEAGTWPAVREAALDVLRAAAEREECGDELAGALLDDGEPAQAWLAAQKHGCRDRAWLEVARAHGTAHPADVLPGYREAVHRCLERTGRDAYREVAVLLEELRDLSARCGEPAACEALVGWIRERHHRRRALLTELARRGL